MSRQDEREQPVLDATACLKQQRNALKDVLETIGSLEHYVLQVGELQARLEGQRERGRSLRVRNKQLEEENRQLREEVKALRQPSLPGADE